MAIVKPPKYVRQALITLQSRGYPAYLVGGCVRDMLLGQRPHDWDVCTGALPEQVMDLFPGSRPTGLRHGTVTVTVCSRQLEITTFRAEGAYSDHRHPDMVRFVSDLTADLSRRDFTMNAVALSADGMLADPFGGAEDIRRRLIRCVGEPEERFKEDALRMFRALRFSARLDFDIDLFTMEGIRRQAPLAACLAPERVRDELEKILLTRSPETVFTAIELGLLDRFLQSREVDPAMLRRLERLPRKRTERWAGLSLCLLRAGCISSVAAFLGALRLDGRTIRCCGEAAALLSSPPPDSRLGWKRMLRDYGLDTVNCAAVCSDAFSGGSAAKTLREILKSGECFSLRHLAVGGDDLLALGLRGEALGEMLDFLLDYVIEFPENNRRELLLALAAGSED